MRKTLILSFLVMLTSIWSCSSLLNKKESLSGAWFQTEFSPICKNIIDSRISFGELICGSWINLNFYLKKYFHVQALRFKYATDKDFLFEGKGEMAGGRCFVGISANVYGSSIYVHGDEKTRKANAVIFQISAIDVNTNKETKSYCSVKYDSQKNKWCALGIMKELSKIKDWTKSNPNCPR